jgi:hypothetical protein
VDTRRTTPEGPLDAAGDELCATAPLATVMLQQNASPQTVTVEVTLPPLAKPEVEEEVAIRIDDVPVDATTVGFTSVGTSSIELSPWIAAMDASALFTRSTGPMRVPPGLRTTGPTPRIPSPIPRAPHATGSAPDPRLTGDPVPFGGHVPGATGEVARLDGRAGARGSGLAPGANRGSGSATASADGGSTADGSLGTTRATRRDLKQVTKDAARSLAARLVDGLPARREG